MESAAYSLGSGDPEIERLDAQAAFLSSPTRVLLGASGIRPGMRALDLGTGLGHVARAVGELVGPEGEVVGLDNSPKMLEIARSRTEGLPHVRFVEGDVLTWRDDAPFDVVVGRLILFHLPDPVAALRHHLKAVRPGGLAVMLDFDIGAARAEPPAALVSRMADLIMSAFRRAGADPTIGSKLRGILDRAGLVDVGGFGLLQYLPADDPIGSVLLSGVVRSLAPVMVAHDLATADELELDTLTDRIRSALLESASVMVPPVLAGAWGRLPSPGTSA